MKPSNLYLEKLEALSASETSEKTSVKKEIVQTPQDPLELIKARILRKLTWAQDALASDFETKPQTR